MEWGGAEVRCSLDSGPLAMSVCGGHTDEGGGGRRQMSEQRLGWQSAGSSPSSVAPHPWPSRTSCPQVNGTMNEGFQSLLWQVSLTSG